MTNNTAATRPAILTVKTARATLTALISDDKIDAFKPDARTLADDGREVTFKLMKSGSEITVRAHDVDVIRALAAFKRSIYGADRVVSVLIVRNGAHVVVWAIVDPISASLPVPAGRGYAVAIPEAGNVMPVTAAPLASRRSNKYMWGMSRIKEVCEPGKAMLEDAQIVVPWMDI